MPHVLHTSCKHIHIHVYRQCVSTQQHFTWCCCPGGAGSWPFPPQALCSSPTLIPGLEEQSSPHCQHNNDAAPTSFLQDLLKHREHEPKHTEYKVNVSVLVTGAINLLRKVTTVQYHKIAAHQAQRQQCSRPLLCCSSPHDTPHPHPAPGNLWP